MHLGFDIRLALRKMSSKNLMEANPDPLVSMWHHSHPTIVQRVEAVAKSIGERDAAAKKAA